VVWRNQCQCSDFKGLDRNNIIPRSYSRQQGKMYECVNPIVAACLDDTTMVIGLFENIRFVVYKQLQLTMYKQLFLASGSFSITIINCFEKKKKGLEDS